MFDQVVKSNLITILYSMMILTMISGFIFGQKTPLKGNSPSGFVADILKANEISISSSNQLIIVTAEDYDMIPSETTVLQKTGNGWSVVFTNINSVLGKKGFAKPGEKMEGDWKTPSGIYRLGLVFGYAPKMETAMPYRQATENDFWVDDPDSPQYNTWVNGAPNAKSFEKMKRKDHLYKKGFVVEYNTNPIIKGSGSAIFFHVWRRSGAFTAGCVAMAEEDISKIIRFLDPEANPVVIMGTKDDIIK
jgi:L,D-peptidoglycan transpeptidase YkuD (ErfK/YbiS/YcfS/YnhG family)